MKSSSAKEIFAENIQTSADFEKNVLSQFQFTYTAGEAIIKLKALHELFLLNQRKLTPEDKILNKMHELNVEQILIISFHTPEFINHILSKTPEEIQQFRRSENGQALKEFLNEKSYSVLTISSEIKILRAYCGCSQLIPVKRLGFESDAVLDKICAKVFLAGRNKEKIESAIDELRNYCTGHKKDFASLIQTILITNNPNYSGAEKTVQSEFSKMKKKLLYSKIKKEPPESSNNENTGSPRFGI